ncbi:galactokinase [Bradyrhizobium sp. CCGB12]|uniref:GHMP family kinase ATP-binding protein n=1 Tax=Bradyrhizobium sp. CCGB12 TaxID=2949632 RepID=UPI0020B3B860|nr:galactokinase [Bradyrhizobium sp. CCGB12]MCP3391890.1 galactokinase [Bradyrhizobium sp. CCGB12]
MIITRTPYRVSFFGGGTDYPAWIQEHGGAVLATAIDKYCYITCRRLPPFFEHKHRIVYSIIENVSNIDQIKHPAVRATLQHEGVTEGLEIHHDGDLPARSGLGSSSSFTVGLLHAVQALRGNMSNKDALAKTAIHIEQKMLHENVGCQDQVIAAYGGMNYVRFRADGTFDVSPVIASPERKAQLKSYLMLCFTGFSRFSSEVAKSQLDNMAASAARLKRMRLMVDEGVEIFVNRSLPIEAFGELLHEAWLAKRTLSDKVTTDEIDAIYEAARDAGAIGGKLLGAGGGGFMLLFAKPERHAAIRERLKSLIHVPFDFEDSGSRVVLYQPNGL